jgi:hypothetical protein
MSHHIKGETKDMAAKPAPSKAKAAPTKTSAKGGAKKK